MNIYKSLSPGDQRIFTTAQSLEETPEGFAPLVTVYHVQRASKSEADYSVTHQGSTLYYKFTSAAGRTAHKAGGRVIRTLNPAAVTCPACLSILEIETADLHQEIARLEEARREREAAIAEMENPTTSTQPPTVTVGDSTPIA